MAEIEGQMSNIFEILSFCGLGVILLCSIGLITLGTVYLIVAMYNDIKNKNKK